MEYKFNFSEWPINGDEELKNLVDVVKSGFWAGSRAKQLKNVRKNFLVLQKGQFGFPLANGTVTIETALYVLNIGYNDEVIVPALTFYSTVSAVSGLCSNGTENCVTHPKFWNLYKTSQKYILNLTI